MKFIQLSIIIMMPNYMNLLLLVCTVKHNTILNRAMQWLTHWGRCQAIIWTNARILLIEALGTKFSEMLSKIHTFSFKKMHFKMLSAKWWPFCLSLNVLRKNRGQMSIVSILGNINFAITAIAEKWLTITLGIPLCMIGQYPAQAGS